MNSFCSVTLVGRLTRDAEMRSTNSGTSVVRFSVAVDRRRKEGEGYITETSFFDVSYFGQSAKNICMYLEKGLLVGVTGELIQRRWENQDGTKSSKIEVIANNVHLIESKSMREGRSQNDGQGSMTATRPSEQRETSGIKQYIPDEDFGPDSFNDDNVPF